MKEERIKALIYGHLSGKLTPLERKELEDIGRNTPELWDCIRRLEDPDLLTRDLLDYRTSLRGMDLEGALAEGVKMIGEES